MVLSLRRATDQDYEALCGLLGELDSLHREALPQVFRKPEGPARTKDYISHLLAEENGVVFVAERDGEVIGFVQAAVQEARAIPIMVPRCYVVIGDLVVKDGLRRLGVGRLLAEKAHQWAVSKGASQIELNVWEFNQGAIAFYEKLGYSAASRRMWKALG